MTPQAQRTAVYQKSRTDPYSAPAQTEEESVEIWGVMKFAAIIGLIWAGLLLATTSGCKNGASSSPAAQVSSQPPGPTRAQAKLPTLKLLLGNQELIAEIARTPDQVQSGMMFRQQMEENEAMLFVFAGPHQASFWMRNTKLPLSCAYIDSEGVILEVHDLKPYDEKPVVAQSDQVQYVLETVQGWFPRHQIGTGTLIRTERGSLAETFFGSRL